MNKILWHRGRIVSKLNIFEVFHKELSTLIHFEYLQTIPNLLRTLATE